MTKPRKKYRPKPVYTNTIQRAMESAAKLPMQNREELKAIVCMTLNDFKLGLDCASNWRSMADALNVAEALCHIGICSDDGSRDRIAAGQGALSAVNLRHRQRGTWALRPAEMQALDDALWTHRIQLDHCSRREYERAVERVKTIAQQARAGNAGAGVEVLTA